MINTLLCWLRWRKNPYRQTVETHREEIRLIEVAGRILEPHASGPGLQKLQEVKASLTRLKAQLCWVKNVALDAFDPRVDRFSSYALNQKAGVIDHLNSQLEKIRQELAALAEAMDCLDLSS